MTQVETRKGRKKLYVARIEADIKTGLNGSDVAFREKAGLVNRKKSKSSKSVQKIIFDNLFTYFNLVWAILYILLISVGAYKDLIGGIIVFANILIAIAQELKAKIILQKMAFITIPKIKCVRGGKTVEIRSSELVTDDIYFLHEGNQIPADSIVCEGEALVNESILTGESKPIKKTAGSIVLAGSFISSGKITLRADKVGNQTYLSVIEKQAKKFKSPSSDLFRDLNKIIKIIGIIIIPIAAAMFLNNFFALGKQDNIAEIIAKTCGAICAMIPAGMYLLVTVALSAGAIKLSKKKTLVEDIYSIEMLAKTNVLCLDKTGTITDGTMNVTEFEIFNPEREQEIKDAISNLLAAQSYHNTTGRALVKHFGQSESRKVTGNIAFSSEKKYMAAAIEGFGTIAVGAFEFVPCECPKNFKEKAAQYAENGSRVLVVAAGKKMFKNDELSGEFELKAEALIQVDDHIRPDAAEIIKWFNDNEVDVKIISGDNPHTVCNIAKKVEVRNADKCISLEGMSNNQIEEIAADYTIFGRVTPEQKYILVKKLKSLGKVVAMTGDGVNDTLALKEADCSIAMADGSDVARGIANIVLLDNKFSRMPDVVKEGRQIINNVQLSSTLYLMKTIFAFLFSFITIAMLAGYPFNPNQMLMLEALVIGIPSYFLALMPNSKLFKGNFIKQVLKRSFPFGVLMFISCAIILVLGKVNILSAEEVVSLSTLTVTLVGFTNLVFLCIPFTKIKIAAVAVSAVLIAAFLSIMPDFFDIEYTKNVLLALVFIVSFAVLAHLVYSIIVRAVKNKKEKNKIN